MLTFFFIFAIFALFFIFIFSRFSDKKVQDYIFTISKCWFLAEEQCVANPHCEVIYKPDEDGTDPVFESCIYIPESRISTNLEARELCLTTGGQWETNKFGSFCQCNPQVTQTAWDKELGCTPMLK